jgi:hypothetical protein
VDATSQVVAGNVSVVSIANGLSLSNLKNKGEVVITLQAQDESSNVSAAQTITIKFVKKLKKKDP